MTERFGLYGGSFDPVHRGHLAVALGALRERSLDKVLLVVARVSPLKRGTSASAADRWEMVRLAIGDLPPDVRGRVEPYDAELRREGPSYTIDTVREFAAAHPGAEIYWIIGSDSLATLPRWRAARELLQEAMILIAPRRGVAREALDGLEPSLGAEGVRALRDGWLPIPMVLAASTDVRARVAAGEPISDLVTPGVEAMILERGLYRAAP